MKRFPLFLGAIVSAFASGAASAKEPADVQFLTSAKAAAANVPFSEAVRVDNTLYLSGQLGTVPGTRDLVAGGIKEQTRQVMTNIKTTLESHGYTMRDLVKCTVMLSDIANWADFNEVYKTFFDGRYPARSALGANGLALGGLVEVECIAVLGAGK
jgi:2-iminobutanoate/2-iminopropanoate deaminase